MTISCDNSYFGWTSRLLCALAVVACWPLAGVAGDAVAATYPPVRQGSVQSDAPQSVAVDGSGNRYVVGNFSGALDFNPGIGADVKASAGNNDAYVTRFNADGSYGWTQIFGGNRNDYALAVAVSGTTVYVSGWFQSTNAGVGGTGATTSSGGEDAFVLALDASTGAAVIGFGSGGVQKFGGTGSDRAYGVAVSGTRSTPADTSIAPTRV